MISTEQNDTEKRVELIVELIMENKGEEIIVLDLRKITSVTDFFILTTGNSSVQVKAIANGLLEKMKKNYKLLPWHNEGFEAQKWILIDYVDIVVHVFDRESRSFYDIENLWKDAVKKQIKTDY